MTRTATPMDPAAHSAPAPQRADQVLLPPWAPRVALTALLLLLACVATLRLWGYSPAEPPGAVVAQRTLHFVDAADGAVLVRDVNGSEIARMRGEQGFLRGVLRGLARDRRQHGLGTDAPLHLSLRDDGRLLLTDPATGARIDLASFGPDNAAVFAAWLPAAPPSGGVPR